MALMGQLLRAAEVWSAAALVEDTAACLQVEAGDMVALANCYSTD